MPADLVRIVRSMSFVALAALAGGCANANPSGPGDARLGRAVGPSGLEQRIVTTVEAPPPGSPYTALLTATSTLTNTGSASAHLTSRVCLFLDADVETTAQLDRFEPTISCAAISAEGDLAPGQSTELAVQFGVRSTPGNVLAQASALAQPGLPRRGVVPDYVTCGRLSHVVGCRRA